VLRATQFDLALEEIVSEIIQSDEPDALVVADEEQARSVFA
jgi:hypothetical protein